jgi:pantoate--beta-alanine ligase
MGALHEGHVSLVQAACRECDFVVVSIFVNPTQFGPHEDFDKYPRTLAADLQALSTCRVGLVYAPPKNEIYPPGFATYVEPAGVALNWEGQRRPGHFRGVATVVLKLFEQVAPDVAYFGRKDYQQTLVVRQMVRDLDLPVRVVVCPTVRESDGLALSSRNRYLSADERREALVLSRSLRLAAELVDAGERDARVILERMRALWAQQPLVTEDYIAIVDPDTMIPVERVEHPTVVAVAARVGTTRLIDNDVIGEWLPQRGEG